MQPGSLVVIKPYEINPAVKSYITWTPVGDEKTIYVIREIIPIPNIEEMCVFLEEGVVGIAPNNLEIGIGSSYVVEVQLPMNITELIEETLKQTV